jgi:putative transposase
MAQTAKVSAKSWASTSIQKNPRTTWMDFLEGLKKRGLYGPLMITSDAHGGIKAALQRQFPEAPWQRCQFHFSKNIVELAPKKYQAALRADLNALFQAKTMKEVRSEAGRYP